MHPPRVGTPPVVGSRRPRAQVRRCKLICWDLGGQAALRAIWEKYYSEAHGLIYVVDAADTERIDESRNVRAPRASGRKSGSDTHTVDSSSAPHAEPYASPWA